MTQRMTQPVWGLRLLFVALALSAFACGKRTSAISSGAAPVSSAGLRPAIEVRDDTPNLFLTWIDPQGDFHTAQDMEEIPLEGRDAVRVVITTREEGSATTDWVYVANVTQKKPDGTYAVITMTRAEWDALAAKRREKKLTALAPHAVQDPASAPSNDALTPPAQNPVTVIVYGASWCGPCHQAQEYLKRKNIPFVYKDIEATPGAEQEMQRKLDRASIRGGSIPMLDVGGRILIGFSSQEIDAALASGKAKGTTL